MKNIAILVPETAVAEGVTGPRYLFSTANQFLHPAGKEPLFNVKLVGTQENIKVLDGPIIERYGICYDIEGSKTGVFHVFVPMNQLGDQEQLLCLCKYSYGKK